MKNIDLNRYSPLKLNDQMTLSNRIVIPPMASETADTKGDVTAETLAHYSRLAEAGASLIIAEYSFVHISGRSEEFQLGISNENHIAGLKALSDRIHQRGALAGIQLTHAGGKSERCFTDGALPSPSGVIVPVKDRTLEVPDKMDLTDIENWKTWFIEASDRAAEANFDLVEIHAAHGYGLNQWLSPITNKRRDEYGGTLKNNLRLLLEIIGKIRTRHPELALSVRIPGQDFIEGGLSLDDSILIAQALEESGVDIINVSSGIGGWRRPRTRNGEGYLVEEASIIQNMISIPVIGVGGIETGSYIDELIGQKKVSLTAVGRAILKDPKTWGQHQLGSSHYV